MREIEDWGSSKYGAQIAVTVPKRVYSPGETIVLTVYLRRRDGEERLRVINSGAWQNYALTLRSRLDGPVSASRFGRSVDEGFVRFMERGTLDLRSGAVLITTIPLNALFDVTMPDVYVLSTSRRVWVDGNADADVLESNEIEIEVSQDVGSVVGDILLL
jgi:hypothetical protein